MRVSAFRSPVVPVVIALFAGTASLAAWQFKSGASTVAVYATVTDKDGRLVPDLTQEDFEIQDNGQTQTISLFASEAQPITVIMMLDRSGSMKSNFRLLEAAGEAFVRKLQPGDKARIGSFADKIKIDPEDFTGDQNELIRILRTELQEQGPTPLWNAVDTAVTGLLQQEGRRVVLVFTDGMDNPGNFKPNNSSLMDVLLRAQKENVMVYAVGLESRSPGRPQMGGGGFGGFGGNPLGVERPDPGLAHIAGETGGGYFELKRSEDLASTFARVADELHRQYALGFAPAKFDGKKHDLQVKIKKSGMKARARKSYIAARPS